MVLMHFNEIFWCFFNRRNYWGWAFEKNKDAANDSDDDIIEIEGVEGKEEATTSDEIHNTWGESLSSPVALRCM